MGGRGGHQQRGTEGGKKASLQSVSAYSVPASSESQRGWQEASMKHHSEGQQEKAGERKVDVAKQAKDTLKATNTLTHTQDSTPSTPVRSGLHHQRPHLPPRQARPGQGQAGVHYRPPTPTAANYPRPDPPNSPLPPDPKPQG